MEVLHILFIHGKTIYRPNELMNKVNDSTDLSEIAVNRDVRELDAGGSYKNTNAANCQH